MNPANALQEKLDLQDMFRRELKLVCQERNQRPTMVTTEQGTEPEWVLYERYRMLEAVNRVRVARGMGCVSASDIRRADRRAMGHVDWIDKFPLYCAELALGTV